jgi:hypothetical protein
LRENQAFTKNAKSQRSRRKIATIYADDTDKNSEFLIRVIRFYPWLVSFSLGITLDAEENKPVTRESKSNSKNPHTTIY